MLDWHSCQICYPHEIKILLLLLVLLLIMHKLFTVCKEQVRSPYTEHAASGLPNPTHLEEEVRFDQAQDQQVVTTRSPRIVTECLLTRSMLNGHLNDAQTFVL